MDQGDAQTTNAWTVIVPVGPLTFVAEIRQLVGVDPAVSGSGRLAVMLICPPLAALVTAPPPVATSPARQTADVWSPPFVVIWLPSRVMKCRMPGPPTSESASKAWNA